MALFFTCRAIDPKGRDRFFAFNLDQIIKVEFPDNGPDITGAIITTSEKLIQDDGQPGYYAYTITELETAKALLDAIRRSDPLR